MKGICRAIQMSAMIAVLVTIGACAKPDPYTPPIRDDNGNVIAGSIGSIETVMLGGVA